MQSYHEWVWEFVVLIVLLGALVLLAAPWTRDVRVARFGWDAADHRRQSAAGRHGGKFVTVAGVINGPNVNEHRVYGRIAIDVAEWPTVGQLVRRLLAQEPRQLELRAARHSGVVGSFSDCSASLYKHSLGFSENGFNSSIVLC